MIITRRKAIITGVSLAMIQAVRAQSLLPGLGGRPSRGRRISPLVASDPFDGDTFYVNTASTPGGDGTTNLTTGASRAFASVAECLTFFSGEGVILVPTRVFLSGTAADTVGTQGLWDFETSPTNRFYLIGNNTTGKYNTSAWRLEVTNADAFYNNLAGHVTMLYLQVQVTGTSGSNHIGIRLATANNNLNNPGPVDHRVIGCIAKLVMSGATNVVGFSSSVAGSGAGSGTCKFINCVSQGNGTYGSNTDESGWAAANVYSYNCTNYGNSYGWLGAQKCVNSLSTNSSVADFDNSVGSTGHSNNASEDGTAKGTNSRTNQTFSLVNAGAGDFQLQSGDTGAKGFGLADPASGLFSDDITGATRTNPWDIGAWKAAA